VTVTTSPTAVTVFSSALLAVNDTVQLNTSATTLTVTEITSTTAIKLITSSGTVDLITGDRLVPTNSKPTLYSDEGASSTLANPVTVTTSGEALFYIKDNRFDYIVTGTGITDRLVIDELGGYLDAVLNVKDFQTLADAISACPPYGIIDLPAGTYTATSTAGWTISKPLTLRGQGSGTAQAALGGTILAPYSSGGNTSNSNVLTITSGDVTISNLMIADPNGNSTIGTGNGITINPAAGISNILIEKVWVYYMGNHGIYIAPASGSVDVSVLRDVICNNNKGSGLYAVSFAYPQIVGGFYAGNGQYAIYMEACGHARLWGVSTQNNQSRSTDATYHAQVRLKTCYASSLIGCAIEDFGGYTCERALCLENCVGGTVQGCYFINANDTAGTGTTGVFLVSDCYGWTIGSNTFDYTTTAVAVNGGANNNWGNKVELQVIRVSGASTGGSISMPTDNYNQWNFPKANGSNLWGGIQIPNVSARGDITITPQKGMLCFDIATGKAYCYDGAAWQALW
jgi:hypothetical protein